MNINTFKNKIVATKHWLEFLRTPSAKSQLIKHIRTEEREHRLLEAIQGLNQFLKDFHLPLYRSEKCKLCKLADLPEVEKRLLSVLDKQETYGNLIRDAYPELLKNDAEKTVAKDVDLQAQDLKQALKADLEKVSPQEVIVDNNQHLNCFFCPECQPQKSEKIIAKSTKDGIKIHSTKCKALKTIALDSLLEAHWKEQEAQTYHFSLKLRFKPRDLTIVDFLQLFTQFNVPLAEMSIKNTES